MLSLAVAMHAKEYTCRVLELIWLTPTVFRLRFEPLKRFDFEPGQFVSVVVPAMSKTVKPVKRCYSFAGTPEEARQQGFYELCIKHVEGGRGTNYMASLSRGDLFRVYAPYGHFTLRKTTQRKNICFVATGTGLAPFRSMALSQQFKTIATSAMVLFGARTADEVFFKNEFERAGVKFVPTVSRDEKSGLFQGRVTDYLKSLPKGFSFHDTDFYLCGNGEMVAEVNSLLRGALGVPEKHIHKEAFSLTVVKKPLVAAMVTETEEQSPLSLSMPTLEEVG